MVLAQPVERVREQEVAHLVAAEVEDQRAPVGMRAAARILVLVERRPVEARERELVAREVRGHPVEDDADPGLVERVHERAEVVRLAHRRDGRVEAGHLVAPGARERVVHHRQELDVREAEVAGVGDELLGELLPAEPQPPRLGVHLVDRDRLLQLVEARGAARASRRRPTRSASGRSARPSSAGSRHGRRTGRPSGAAARRRRAPRTCTRRPRRPRARRAAQIPDEPCGSSGCARPSQRFQSPTTETPRAFGAQTANETPSSVTWAPSRS